jgi:hypothetical protein
MEFFDSNDESIADLLEVCGDASIVDFIGLVDSDDGLSDVTDMVNSDDEFCDNKSLSYTKEEFMSKGLWIAGKETAQILKHPWDSLENKSKCALKQQSTGTRSTWIPSLSKVWRAGLKFIPGFQGNLTAWCRPL